MRPRVETALREPVELLLVTVKAPALGELNNGVSYAFHVSPWSLVARTLAMAAPPVAIHAFRPP